MSVTISTAVLIFAAFVVPASSISCMTGVECNEPHCNKTLVKANCPLNFGQDTCMKLDFGTYISKTCVPQSACSANGLRNYVDSLQDTYMKNLLNSRDGREQLDKNMNHEGRTVINCCQDADYCNSGMYNALSPMAVFGLVLAFMFA